MLLTCASMQMTTAMDRMSSQRTPRAQGGAAQVETPRGTTTPRSAHASAHANAAVCCSAVLMHFCPFCES